jgi:oligosaccharide repeat unit polymerase
MDAHTALFFVFIGNLLAWIGCTYYAVWIKRAPLYHPMVLFLIYFFFGYVYRPLADWIQGYSDIWLHDSLFPTPPDIFYAMFISIVGLVSFVFIPPLLNKSIHDRLSVRPTRFVVTRPTVFWIAVAVVGVVGFVSTVGGLANTNSATIGQYVSERQLTGGTQLVGVSGYQTLGQEFVPALIFLLLLKSGITRTNIALVAGVVMLRLYEGTERSGFLAMAFAFLLAMMFRNGMQYLRFRYIVLIVVLVAAFDVLGGDRLAIQDIVTGNKTISDVVSEYQHGRGSALPLSDVQEFDSTTLVTMLVPERTGYNWFSQYMRLFIWPIPRQIWPDKPVLTSRIVWMRYGNFFGQTMSMMGDAYTNFGFASVVLVMALYGAGLSWLFKRAQATASPTLFGASAVFAIQAPLLFRDGEVGAYYYIFAWIAVLAVLCIAGRIRLQRRYGSNWRIILPPKKGRPLIALHPEARHARISRIIPRRTAANIVPSINESGP